MIGSLIRSVMSRFLLILFILVSLPFLILFLLIPRNYLLKSKFFFWCEHLFHRFVFKTAWVPITFKGTENMISEPAIYVGNHQSSADIPLAGYLMNKHPHVWMSWAELKKSPLLRFVLPKVSILVDMSTSTSGMRSIRQAISLLQQLPVHVIIFPEGGRFNDGTVHKFYKGFSLIAKKTGRPVVPFYIEGVSKVYPPGSFIVRYHPITVTVGQPMRIQEQETDQEFTDRVHQWFVAQSKGSA